MEINAQERADFSLLGHQTEVHALLPYAEVKAGGDVPYPHRVVPVDVPARPLDPGQL